MSSITTTAVPLPITRVTVPARGHRRATAQLIAFEIGPSAFKSRRLAFGQQQERSPTAASSPASRPSSQARQAQAASRRWRDGRLPGAHRHRFRLRVPRAVNPCPTQGLRQRRLRYRLPPGRLGTATPPEGFRRLGRPAPLSSPPPRPPVRRLPPRCAARLVASRLRSARADRRCAGHDLMSAASHSRLAATHLHLAPGRAIRRWLKLSRHLGALAGRITAARAHGGYLRNRTATSCTRPTAADASVRLARDLGPAARAERALPRRFRFTADGADPVGRCQAGEKARLVLAILSGSGESVLLDADTTSIDDARTLSSRDEFEGTCFSSARPSMLRRVATSLSLAEGRVFSVRLHLYDTSGLLDYSRATARGPPTRHHRARTRPSPAPHRRRHQTRRRRRRRAGRFVRARPRQARQARSLQSTRRAPARRCSASMPDGGAAARRARSKHVGAAHPTDDYVDLSDAGEHRRRVGTLEERWLVAQTRSTVRRAPDSVLSPRGGESRDGGSFGVDAILQDPSRPGNPHGPRQSRLHRDSTARLTRRQHMLRRAFALDLATPRMWPGGALPSRDSVAAATRRASSAR